MRNCGIVYAIGQADLEGDWHIDSVQICQAYYALLSSRKVPSVLRELSVPDLLHFLLAGCKSVSPF